MNDITIILTTEDAEKFKVFQKYYALFNMLIEKGVFNIQFGKCILNIAYGEVQNVVKEEVIYKK